ncbi:MAG TPA: type II toxin-antitoxin system RelE/ParE family toxin [Cyclobacteriaceae bacterium]|nr:type II toxin-antitoxin system RelE/ParE family toxin [Cyclobacteriaceae bacterium]HNU41896.1 type II toxin-antitoxin system RelE/ParE family toxin [Cyclobacteriaceae bacterium]
MSYKVEVTSLFAKQLKRLSKKYPSLKLEYVNLVQSLVTNPTQGNSLGNNCFKIRVSIGSKGKGKSGGARVITYIHFRQNRVFLLSIYDKSEQSNITSQDLKNWIAFLI